jgi:hypothetical protein
MDLRCPAAGGRKRLRQGEQRHAKERNRHVDRFAGNRRDPGAQFCRQIARGEHRPRRRRPLEACGEIEHGSDELPLQRDCRSGFGPELLERPPAGVGESLPLVPVQGGNTA